MARTVAYGLVETATVLALHGEGNAVAVCALSSNASQGGEAAARASVVSVAASPGGLAAAGHADVASNTNHATCCKTSSTVVAASVGTGRLTDRSTVRHWGSHTDATLGNIWLLAGAWGVGLCNATSSELMDRQHVNTRLQHIDAHSTCTYRRRQADRRRRRPGRPW